VRIRTLAASSAIFMTAGLLAPGAAFAEGTTTLYVSLSANCSDAGTGTLAVPFCTIQAAADVAEPGDVVSIGPGTFDQSVDITRSGTAAEPITFTGVPPSNLALSTRGTEIEGKTTPITHAISVTGAGYITIENLGVADTASDSIVVSGSSNVVISSISAGAAGYQAAPGDSSSLVHVTGASTAVSVERSWLGTATGPLVAVDDGADGTVVSTNQIEGSLSSPAVEVSGATDTAITSNTAFQQFCGTVLDVTGSATGTTVENNVFDGGYIGTTSVCPSDSVPASEISVDPSATGSTTLDYNDVYEFQSGDSDYSWGGKTYPSAAALTAATGQGAHDINSVEGFYLIDGSPVIDSADSAAPGELTTDLYGRARVDDPLSANSGAGPVTYYDRGAMEVQNPGTVVSSSVTLSTTKAPVGGQITVTASCADTWGDTGPFYLSFGDGTTTTSASGVVKHTYSSPGSYLVYADLVVNGSNSPELTGRQYQVTVVPAGPLVPALTETPVNALGVSLNGTASAGSWNVTGYSFDFGDKSPVVSNSIGVASHTYAKPGTYTVTETVTDAGGESAQTSQTFTTAGSDYTPVGPIRILDTRNGTGAAKAQVGPNDTVKVKVDGTGSIPASGVAAVAVNLTATNTSGSGFVTAYADGTTLPDASNLNYAGGSTVPNMAIVPVGSNGYIDLTNSGTLAGSIDLLADVTGYFTESSGSGYTALSPVRLLDTRTGTGTGGVVAKAKPNQPLVLTIAGADSGALPATGITAVALNVTTTNTTGSGFVTVYPDGTSVPITSNLNFVQGQTVANSVIVPVGSDGKIDLVDQGTLAGSIDLLADVTGYYSTNSAGVYVPILPQRMVDTRNGSPIQPNGTLSTELGGPEASAFVINMTVTDTNGSGFISAYPDGGGIPNVSNLNYTSGQTIADLAQVTPGTDYAVDFTNQGVLAGNVELIVDEFGYYAAS
jgi:PKD repeat protein